MRKAMYLILLTMVLTVGCAKEDSGGSSGGAAATQQSTPGTTITKTLICTKSYKESVDTTVIQTVTYTFNQYSDGTSKGTCTNDSTAVSCGTTAPFQFVYVVSSCTPIFRGTTQIGCTPSSQANTLIFDQASCNSI